MTIKLLKQASKAYYEGTPIMSDDEFDRLADTHKWEDIGYSPDSREPHIFPLFSLQKVFLGEDVAPEYGTKVIETPKLDGAAISLYYKGGNLVRVLTRGDGKEGINVTGKFKASNIVPLTINNFGEVQITGEIVAPKEIANARNYAAGALNLKEASEFMKRELTFIAYNVQPCFSDTYSNDMYLLEALGFNVVTKESWSQFPEDGRVFRVDSNESFEDLGFTAHHPRGAFALKTREQGVVTTLLDVVWQTGKSGKVTPVALLEPVYIEEAKVSRATLNNMAYIEELNLEIGCEVEVIRAGKIIPCVISRVS
jgi:DNA ligase (NAD+)